MIKKLVSLFISLNLIFLPIPVFAQTGSTAPIFGMDQCLWIEEEDGSPVNLICGKMKVSDDSLTDNGDGSFSLDLSASALATLASTVDPSGASYIGVEDEDGYFGTNNLEEILGQIGGLIGVGGVWKSPSVLDKDLATPPGAPSDGDRYIINGGTGGDWYNASWGFRQSVTIDNTKVPSALSNFPVMINITDTNNSVFGNARSDGYDILFTASDKITKLDHELEYYDDTAGNKQLEAHVRIPTLASGADTVIYMYYGNASVSSDPSVTTTWDANFKFVQHLSDLTTSTTKGSVTASNDMTKRAANEPIEVDSKVGKGQSTDGINDYIKTTNNFLSGPSEITISAWIKKESGGSSYETAVHKASGTTIGSSDYWLGVCSSDYLTVTIGANAGVGWAAGKTTTVATYGTWYHLTATWDGSIVRVYLDGTYNKQYNLASYSDLNTDTRVGASSDGSNYQFKGAVDEARISNTARSADWITTGYNNQDSPSTFYTLGSQEAPAATGDWAGYETYITEWNAGTNTWDMEGPPAEGWAIFVNDDDTIFYFNGSTWVTDESAFQHNLSSGLQGGTTDEYYHMTAAENTSATREADNTQNGLMPAGKMTSWDSAWHVGDDIDEELIISEDIPKLRFHDTDDDVAYQVVGDTAGSYPNFSIYKGAVSEGTFTPSPATPLLRWDASNDLTVVGLSLDDLSDVGSSTATTGNLLVSDGANFNATTTIPATITVDGLTMDANEIITLGGQELDHDGTDFVFDDSVSIGGSGTSNFVGDVTFATDLVSIDADDEYVTVSSTADSGNAVSISATSADNALYIDGNFEVTGDITGVALNDLSDVGDTTATAGNIIVGDGTNFDSVAMTGDVGIDALGATTVTDLTISSEAQGDVLYFDGTNWVRLAKGTADYVLTMNDGETAPGWEAAGGGVGSLDDLSDVGSSTATSGNVLIGDGTDFDAGTLHAQQVEVVEIGTATYDDIQDWSDTTQSSGIISGFTITDSGSGEIDVAAGTGIIKNNTTSISPNLFFDYAGQTNQDVLTDSSMNYVYIDYNSGTPIVASTVTRSNINQNDEIGIGRIFRSGTDLKILSGGVKIDDDTGRTHKRLGAVDGFIRATGGATSQSSHKVIVTSGTIYYGLTPLSVPALDTSAAGVFTYLYDDGGTSWTQVANATDINYAKYDDGDGTLGDVNNNQYGIHWLYYCLGTEAYFMVYGTDSYTLSEAEEESSPSALPPCLTNMGFLVSKIIVEDDGSEYHIFAPWEGVFSGAGVSDHGNLAGLTDDDHTQYILRTDGLSSLSDVGDSTSTSGNLLIGDGAKFETTAMSGDATIGADGVIEVTEADALAANGANCTAGSYPLGVDASGAAESCTDATTEIDSAISTHAGDDDAHHALVTLAGQDYLTLVTQQITAGEIEPDDLAASDFGEFTCNGTTCVINSDVIDSDNIKDGEIDISTDTNLTVTAPIVLTDDDLSVSMSLDGLTDVGSSTATAGNLLIGDGDSFESSIITGAITMDGGGTVILQTNYYFGDGYDGAATYNGGGTSTLTEDLYATTVTVTNNTTLDANGFRIFATETVTVNSGSTISDNGGDGGNGANGGILPGPGGTAGVTANTGGGVFSISKAGVAGAVGGNSPDGAGGDGNPGETVDVSIYDLASCAVGGTGGAGGGGGGAGGAAGANSFSVEIGAGEGRINRNFWAITQGRFLDVANTSPTEWNGLCSSASGGGGGGGAGEICIGNIGAGGGSGGSGGNGGKVFISAHHITNNGTISADGGAGGDGGTGGAAVPDCTNGGGGGAGAAGGSGGEVILIYNKYTGNAATADGGTKGSGGAGGSTGGAAGNDGNDGTDGTVFLYQHK